MVYFKWFRLIAVFGIALFTLSFDTSGIVYTPCGSVVDVFGRTDYLTAEDIEAERNYVRTCYPNAYIVGEATVSYNCHAYAWSVSEGGEKYWMNDPTPYMTDGSYTLTNSIDPKATKIFYYGGNHSAVKSSGGYFISKWGPSCLVRHTPEDCPYNTDNLRYYKLSMEILGDTFVPFPMPSTALYKVSG